MTASIDPARVPASGALRARPWRPAAWRAVQLAIAIAGIATFIRTSSIFAAVPDMTSSDRCLIALELAIGQFATATAQLAVLHLVVLPSGSPRAQHIARFIGMVLLGAVIGMSPLFFDAPSLRLGIVESTTTGAWSSLFQSILMSAFLVYQHDGQARSELASRRLQQLQREQRAARRRLVEAQLQAMQARVDPQMFFDLLDSVQRLYATEPPRAEALLDELIVFLRAALPRLRSASSTLAQEVELVASYFRLQTLRGNAPANFVITVPDELAARPFPAGVLLPLVADGHAGAFEVTAQHGADTDIVVALRSTRTPDPRVLAQVRDTLAALYGSAAPLECRDGAAGAPVETRITLPDAAP